MSIEAVRAGFEASFELTQTEDEIWITEQVNNLLFQKK